MTFNTHSGLDPVTDNEVADKTWTLPGYLLAPGGEDYVGANSYDDRLPGDL